MQNSRMLSAKCIQTSLHSAIISLLVQVVGEQNLLLAQTHLQRRPDVKGDLLLHYDVQEAALLLVLHLAARGLDLLLQRAAPLTTIWGGGGVTKTDVSPAELYLSRATEVGRGGRLNSPGKSTWQ